jgi:hypothetical protein
MSNKRKSDALKLGGGRVVESTGREETVVIRKNSFVHLRSASVSGYIDTREGVRANPTSAACNIANDAMGIIFEFSPDSRFPFAMATDEDTVYFPFHGTVKKAEPVNYWPRPLPDTEPPALLGNQVVWDGYTFQFHSEIRPDLWIRWSH